MIKENSDLTNEETTRTNLETVQAIYNRLPEGQSLYVIVKESYEKTINSRSEADCVAVDSDMANLGILWDNLETQVNNAMKILKAALLKFDNFNDRKHKIDKWLTEQENDITIGGDNRGDLGEMRTALERFLSKKEVVLEKKEELCQMGELVSELQVPQLEIDLRATECRLLGIDNKYESKVNELQKEIIEIVQYNQSLQDIEKWLLQISFQLMAHNSLYISNKEQTKEQLLQHDILLSDIQNYQRNIDALQSMGQKQISMYEPFNPYIRSTIEKHIQNIQESYNSLLFTSLQIKNRLEDSLKKFQEYEDTIDDIEKKLDSYVKSIPSSEDVRSFKLEDCIIDLELAKDISNKLNTEKQRLAVAIQACEAATASISRPSSPIEMSMQPVPEKELRVRAILDELTDNVSYLYFAIVGSSHYV